MGRGRRDGRLPGAATAFEKRKAEPCLNRSTLRFGFFTREKINGNMLVFGVVSTLAAMEGGEYFTGQPLDASEEKHGFIRRPCRAVERPGCKRNQLVRGNRQSGLLVHLAHRHLRRIVVGPVEHSRGKFEGGKTAADAPLSNHQEPFFAVPTVYKQWNDDGGAAANENDVRKAVSLGRLHVNVKKRKKMVAALFENSFQRSDGIHPAAGLRDVTAPLIDLERTGRAHDGTLFDARGKGFN